MCNWLQKNYSPIKKSGYGYKIFRKDRRILKGFISNTYYEKKTDLICWIEQYSYFDFPCGFCFFSSKKEAIKVQQVVQKFLNGKTKIVLHKIKYKEGMGKQKQSMISTDYKYCLCKEFKILEEIK